MLVCEPNLETKDRRIVDLCQEKSLRFVNVMEKTSFGQRLRLAFGNAKYAQIAEKMGVSEATIKVYMAGRVPDADKLAKIAELTNCNLHWLLTGQGDVLFAGLGDTFAEPESPLWDKIRSIAHEQAQNVYGHAEVSAGAAAVDATQDLLTAYLLNRALQDFHILAEGEWLMPPQKRKLAEKMTFVKDRSPSMDDQIRGMIAKEISGKGVSSVAQDAEVRAIIRDIVKEEISDSRKRPVFPLRVADADDEIEETTRRKVG